MMFAIEFKNIKVRASKRTILDLEKFEIPTGSFAAIIGPNGAGKTTLLKTCLGFCKSSVGESWVFDREVTSVGRWGWTKLRRQIGYVPQNLISASEMPLTTREVIAIGRSGLKGLFSRLGREDWRTIDNWIDRLGLSDLADKKYGEISGGEQRKTLIARAMVQEPKMLILDEPTAYLDLGSREQIVRTLEKLYADSTITILLVCHELDVLPSCCEQLMILENGKISISGRPKDILTKQRVCDLYGQDFDIIFRGGRCLVVSGGGEV